jgi:predicted transposase
LTFEAVWYPSKAQEELLYDHMRRFQIVKRIAYNCLLKSQSRQQIIDHIRQLALLSNARYIRSAIEEAKATVQAQQELVNLYCRETAWQVKQASQSLKKYQQTVNQKQNPLTKKQYQKLKGLHTRLQKAQSTQVKWQTHRKNKTIPPIVFGGKKNLQLFQQGKISKEEWTKRRNNGVYCVGEKNKRGNANLRLYYDPLTDAFSFSMLLERG